MRASYSSRGVELRVHKNKHRESGLSVEDVGLVQFILNYAGK